MKIPRPAWWAAGVALGLVQVAPAQVPPLRERLEQALSAADTASARSLLGDERRAAAPVVRDLLVERAGHLLTGRADSAAALLVETRALAALYREALADSFALRIVAFHESLPAGRLPALVEGWKRYRECVALGARWNLVRDALPAVESAASRASDPYLELDVQRVRARCMLITESTDAGLREYEKAVEMAEHLGDGVGALNLRVWIGRAQFGADRLAEGIATLSAVLDPAQQAGDWGTWVWATLSIAQCRSQGGELDAAREDLEEGLARIPQVPPSERRHWEGELRGMLAHVLGLSGQVEAAISEGEQARRIQREIGAKGAELGTIIGLAWLYQSLERYSMALSVLQDGTLLAEETGIQEAKALLATQIGETYLTLGRPDEALRHLEEVLPSARALGAPRHEAAVLMGMALAHVDLGDAAGAVAPLEQAWHLAQDTEVRSRAVEILVALGKVRADLGDWDRAREDLARARAVADSIDHPYLLAEAERCLGRVCAAKGEDGVARGLYADAIDAARRHGFVSLLREALVDEADVCARAGELARADSLLAEAVEIVESVRERLAGEELRLGFFTDKKEIYVRRAAVLHELGRDELAFDVAERSRARVLLEVMSAGADAPSHTTAPALRDRERKLSAELAALQAELSQTVSAEQWEEARADSLTDAVDAKAREYRAVLEQGGGLSRGSAPLTLAEIRKRVLGDDQLLLEYLVGSDQTFAFVVGRDRFRALRIPLGAESLRGLVQAARESMMSDRFDPRAAQVLHALLVEPVAAELSAAARLVVVADGPLLHFPFAVLHDGSSFLVEQHAVAQAPSASALDAELRRPRRGGERTLLAVGNPSTYRTVALLDAARDARGWRFGELPFAGEEARKVAARFRKATVLIGEEAREEAVKALAGGATYLHFATHGLLDEDEPLLSGLTLAQDEDPAEDGFLQAHEVMQLGLGADLVVLSACNSGLGRIAGGEGVLGLTRAFLQAGAGAVLISLWEVADRSAAGLMDSFYGALLDDGVPTDMALRHAQLEAMAAGAAPREWAPFVVTAGFEAPASHRTLPLVGAAVTVGLILVAVSRRRRTRSRGGRSARAS
ncbi:MAG: CHAT domain-containing protein [Candidatus Eiseniibacteriota bacterium]